MAQAMNEKQDNRVEKKYVNHALVSGLFRRLEQAHETGYFNKETMEILEERRETKRKKKCKSSTQSVQGKLKLKKMMCTS